MIKNNIQHLYVHLTIIIHFPVVLLISYSFSQRQHSCIINGFLWKVAFLQMAKVTNFAFEQTLFRKIFYCELYAFQKWLKIKVIMKKNNLKMFSVQLTISYLQVYIQCIDEYWLSFKNLSLSSRPHIKKCVILCINT